jgi:ankyrin repeat protein
MWPFTKQKKALDQDGRSDLHYAARDGDLAAVQKLVSEGADVNLQDKHGWTPLHFAAQALSEDVAAYLLAHGAAVDTEDRHGNTPLFRATFAWLGDGAIIRALRAAGADPKKRNKSGVSPVMLARTIANYDIARFYSDVSDA